MQYPDDETVKDSPYVGRCCFELVYQARFSLEIKRASWLDRQALSLPTVTMYNFIPSFHRNWEARSGVANATLEESLHSFSP